eukprot:CAMPEP_0178385744 /NCGR_PEP_ID=MMETSP0689_2-20121128/8186_1 /TAXON_ID=160604 /ORGANISM="Amphidinium massartii, Strain CS-259" /LENGTH=421 /DNA_ID=CAMNT_0020006027 /DNA_START=64 /DNA_END=1325 /DNA_ORIENTATION=+
MKIRAVCYFITASSLDDVAQQARLAVPFFKDVLRRLADLGVPVQMVRFATNSFEEYLPDDVSKAEILEAAKFLDNVCKETSETLKGVACIMSIGDAARHVEVVADILRTSSMLFINMPLTLEVETARGSLPALPPATFPGVPDFPQALRYSKAVIDLAHTGGDGLIPDGPLKGMPLCFKCTVTACLPPGTPFFPGAIAPSSRPDLAKSVPWRAPGFAIATENSDLVVKAFSQVPDGSSIGVAREELRKVLQASLKDLDAMGHSLEETHRELGVTYVGIDPSIATAAAPEDSVVNTWSDLLKRCANMPHGFGGAGTLTISAAVTSALKSLHSIKTCGYAQTEDDGLAHAAKRGEVSLYTLLLNSAVCGTGIDTGLVPGDTDVEELALLFSDVATMAYRLQKPLSCRVWPVHGKSAGDMVHFG